MRSKTNPFNTVINWGKMFLTDKSIKIVFVDKMPDKRANALYDFAQKKIYLPKFDPARFNENEGRDVKVYCIHERKHARISGKDGVFKYAEIAKERQKKGESHGFLHFVFNILEDCRIEANDTLDLIGDLEDLSWYRNKEAAEALPDAEKAQLINPLGWVIHIARYHFLNKHEAFHIEAKNCPIPTEGVAGDLYEKLWNIMDDGRLEKALHVKESGTDTVLELALEIEKEFQKYIEENFDKFEITEGDGSGDGISVPGAKGKGKGGKGKGKGKGINEKFDEMQDEHKVENDSMSEKLDKISEDQGFGDGKGKEDNDSDDDSDMDWDHEPDDSPVKKHKAKEMNTWSPYIGFNIHDREIIADSNPDKFSEVKNELDSRIMTFKNRIAIALKCMSESKTRRNLKRGKIDRTKIYKTQMGVKNVMKKVRPGLEIDTAVNICVDLSGSMGSWRSNELAKYEVAMQMAILLAETFELLGIPFEITGFNTDGGHMNNVEFKVKDDRGFRQTERINYWIFKEFDSTYKDPAVRSRLGSIYAGGCNIDHEVIRWSAGRLWKRREKRKLQIVLSDGHPSGGWGNYNYYLENELKRVNSEIESAGIEQFAFGIQDENVQKFYTNWMVVNEIEDLNEQAIRMFADYLLKGRYKTR